MHHLPLTTIHHPGLHARVTSMSQISAKVHSRLPAVYVAEGSVVKMHLVSKNAWALSAAVTSA